MNLLCIGPLFKAALGDPPVDLQQDTLGPMDLICQFCGALHFRSDKLRKCCHNGTVKLPKLKPYPKELRALLEGTSKDSKNFRENIRNYNSSVALGSLVADIKPPQGFGPYCYR